LLLQRSSAVTMGLSLGSETQLVPGPHKFSVTWASIALQAPDEMTRARSPAAGFTRDRSVGHPPRACARACTRVDGRETLIFHDGRRTLQPQAPVRYHPPFPRIDTIRSWTRGRGVPIGTAVHERTLKLCMSLYYRAWSGYDSASVYEMDHEPDYSAIRKACSPIATSTPSIYLI